MRAGFIGLGNIGRPMAERLGNVAKSVAVYDAMPFEMDGFGAGTIKAQSLAEIAKSADIIGVCVRDDADVAAVVDGPDGLLAHMQAGGLIAVHSTVRPSTIIRLANAAHQLGIALIDAAITGGPDGARAGSLTTMVGATLEQLDQARPFLNAFSKGIVHAGEQGRGMTLKIANNLVTYIELLGGVEAFRLATKGGLDPALLVDVMSANGNLTPAMKAFVSNRQTGVERMGEPAFQASQAAVATLAEKDLGLAQEIAAELGIEIPLTTATAGLFRQIVMETGV